MIGKANDRKEKQKEAKKKYVATHAEKRKESLRKSNEKRKAKEWLKKNGGDVTEDSVNDLLAVWDSKQ
jgi:hypothetical protein